MSFCFKVPQSIARGREGEGSIVGRKLRLWLTAFILPNLIPLYR